MAFLDNPENKAAWESELSALREERARRENRLEPESSGINAPEAAVARSASPVSKNRTASFGREPITLEQLEIEAGVKHAPSASRVAQGPELTAEKRMAPSR